MRPTRVIVDLPAPLDNRQRQKRRFSHAAMSKLLTDPDWRLTTSERLIALIIFQHARMNTLRCYPSVQTICRRGKVSKNTVARTIKKLYELDLMVVNKTRSSGKFMRNEYDFSPLVKKLDQVPKRVSGVVGQPHTPKRSRSTRRR